MKQFILLTIVILLLPVRLFSQVALQPQDLPNDTKLPIFWKSTLEDITQCVAQVKMGTVNNIATSPGGRPVFAVSYGRRDTLRTQANYNSAVAARNPAYYARKDSTSKPVVCFLGPVHGQEMEGIVGLLNLIQIAETGQDYRGQTWQSLREKLAKCRIIIIPSANPDGRNRCPYDSFVGIPTRIMTKYGQGTREDGSLYGWPGAKAVHPMTGDVGILGAYFNDDGINPMHDDFFHPMAAETEAVMQVVRTEAPDLTVCLHSHENKPVILPASYVPMFVKKRIQKLSESVKARFERENLPYGGVAKPQVEDENFPPSKYFNLVSAMHHVSGTMAFTFECSHGSISKPDGKTAG